MKIKTTELIFAAAAARNYQKDGQEKVFRSATFIDGNGDTFEAGLSEKVFAEVAGIKAATGTATFELSTRQSKVGRPSLRLELLSFEL